MYIQTEIYSQGEGTILSWGGKILITKYRETRRNRKFSLEHRSSNCCTQDPPGKAKFIGQSLSKRKSKVKYVLISKGDIVTHSGELWQTPP